MSVRVGGSGPGAFSWVQKRIGQEACAVGELLAASACDSPLIQCEILGSDDPHSNRTTGVTPKQTVGVSGNQPCVSQMCSQIFSANEPFMVIPQ
jgi:hypothetical protein